MADCPSRTRSGRRRHWKLPDMIQGVRHRFRDKRRSKSPDCLDTDTNSVQQEVFRFPEKGRSGLPRAASMLSTDYGFSPTEWGQPRPPAQNGVLSDCDLTRSGPSSSSSYQQKTGAKASSVSAVNQAGLSHGISHGSSIQRGKSVRFGENRISVFLQDSTQALEECVRLALSYAEESKRGEQCCSDSEAVSLSRSLTQSQDSTSQSDRKPNNAWSDSEDLRGGRRVRREERQSSGDYYSQFSCPDGPPTPTNYKPKSFGQAVNSLDRVERLDKARSHQDKSRKKRSAQINEIFSFIDKILSGCDSGCNDEFCPFVRQAQAGDWRSKQSYNQKVSSLPAQYGPRAQYSLQGPPASQPYAYRGALPTEGQSHDSEYSFRSGTGHSPAVAGFISDSDCDTSESSTLLERGRPARPPRSRLRRQEGGGQLASKRTTEDVFAQIIICCESNKESLGMPKYGHIHQKISQTVCNAIFLCKVTIHPR